MVDQGKIFGAITEETLTSEQQTQTKAGFFKTSLSVAGELGQPTLMMTTAKEVMAMSYNAANPGQLHILVRTEMNEQQLEYWLFDTTQQKAVSRTIL